MSDRKTIDPRIKLTLLPIASFTSFFISGTIFFSDWLPSPFFCMYTVKWEKEHYALSCFLRFYTA